MGLDTQRNRRRRIGDHMCLRQARAAGVLLAAVLLAAGLVTAETVTIEPVRDNTLYETSDGSLSNGAGLYLFAGRTNQDELRRAVLGFDVAGNVPSGATVTDVELTMTMSKTIAGTVGVELYRLLEGWGEAGSNATTGGGGQGAPSENGDATWIHTFYPDDMWMTAGGTYAGQASVTTDVAGNGEYTWTSADGMVADVQGWLDDPASNLGWIVIADESGQTSAKRFNSRESSTPPQLTITYTPAANEPPVAGFEYSPQSPAVGEDVVFSDTSTGEVTSWSWDFGDGASSSEQSPTHVFEAAGSYTVTLTVENAQGSDSASASIVVSDNEPELTELVFVPASASATGAQSSFFLTDLDVNNAGNVTMTFELWWLARGEDNSSPLASATFLLEPGESRRFSDVVGDELGLTEAVGAIIVAADVDGTLVTSRTFNSSDEGTFGQSIQGVPADEMIVSGQRARILFMTENTEFRSNLGVLNGVQEPMTVQYELFDSQGTSLEMGSIDLDPWGNTQLNSVFADYTPIAGGYVDVWTDDAGAFFTCYGSVLDNRTSDPTTVPPQ